MSTKQPLEESILAEARAGMGLSEQKREARFVALRAGISAGTLPSIEEDLAANPFDFAGRPSSGPAALGSGPSAMEWLWGVNPLRLVGASLVLGGALGFFLGLKSAPTAPAVDSAKSVAQSPAPTTVEDTQQIKKEDDRLEVAPSEIPFEEDPALAPTEAPDRALKSDRPTTPLSEEAPEPSFHEELAYLRRAQAALRSGQPALAWGLMQSLDELQKGGALGLERRVTKTLALCALERTSEAKAMAEPLLRAQSDSVYARRLSESCAGSPDTAEDFEKK